MKKSVLFFLALVLFIFVCFNPAQAQHPPYLIKVSISQCKLWLFEIRDDGSMQVVREYKAGTAKRGLEKYPLGEGVITEISFNPTWYPTAYTREFLAKLGHIVPAVVSPSHPLNYMGAFYLKLSHDVPGKGSIYCIHGVRQEDDCTVGKNVSGGCVRMHNKDGKELAALVSVGTKVIIVK